MKIKNNIKLHCVTQLVSEIDVETVEKKVLAIPGVVLDSKLRKNDFNIMKLDLNTDNNDDVNNFITEMSKIIRDHGIKRSSIEINQKIEINNE